MSEKIELIEMNRNWICKINEEDVRIIANTIYKIDCESKPIPVYCTFRDKVILEDGEEYLQIKYLFTLNTNICPVLLNQNNRNNICVSDIKSISPVNIYFIRSQNRPKGQHYLPISNDNIKKYTFAFDVRKYDTKYKITIASNNFVAIKIRTNDAFRYIYGLINNIDQDSGYVTISCYDSRRNKHTSSTTFSIINNYKIKLDDIVGIYYYEISDTKPVSSDVNKE